MTKPRKPRAGSGGKAVATRPPSREANCLEKAGIDRAKKFVASARGRYQVRYNPEQAQIQPPHDDDGYYLAQAAAFGTTSTDFIASSISDLASVLRGQGRAPSEQAINAALAFVDGGEPQNEIEASLLVQMASTHAAAMQCMRTAAGDLRLATEGGVGNLAVKLLRTYTAQIEALTKLRRGGEQVVRHIHVDNRGGQAIIAETVNTGGAGHGKVAEQSETTIADAAFGPQMFSQDPAGNGVPIPCREGPAPLQNARRDESRRTARQPERVEARHEDGAGDRGTSSASATSA
ncbi:hypothetical protein LRS08_18695 [Sphingomonas sp. J315]|nr:hypothetical protein [Sphingomonas sp. J315]UUX99440.1 hypothetical protein LRS08_18695 [Sphingomonas sp. J315]